MRLHLEHYAKVKAHRINKHLPRGARVEVQSHPIALIAEIKTHFDFPVILPFEVETGEAHIIAAVQKAAHYHSVKVDRKAG